MPRVAAVHVQQVTPDGPITDAPAPVPVSFTLQWVLHEQELGSGGVGGGLGCGVDV